MKRLERAINRLLERAFGRTERSRRAWLHLINDNDLPGSSLLRPRRGSALQKGRAYLHIGDDAELHVGWSLGKLGLGWGITVDDGGGDDQLSGHVELPGAYLHGGFRGLLPRKFPEWIGTYKPHERTGQIYVARRIGVSFFDRSCWVNIWKPDGGWSSTDPWWWSFNFSLDPRDLLGPTRLSRETIEERDVEIPMPERPYKGKARMEAVTRIRPRWPRWPLVERWLIANVNLDEDPIPVPGKGENAYDCGPDATYGMSGPFASIEEAIGAVVASALRDRKRYGGSHRYDPGPERAGPRSQDEPAQCTPASEPR